MIDQTLNPYVLVVSIILLRESWKLPPSPKEERERARRRCTSCFAALPVDTPVDAAVAALFPKKKKNFPSLLHVRTNGGQK